MYNNTSEERLVAFFQRLLLQLQPIALCLNHFTQVNHSDYEITGQLNNALLQAAGQHGSPSLIVLTQLPRQETQNFGKRRLPQVLGPLQAKQMLCVHLLHSEWDVEYHNDFMKGYLNSRQLFANDVYPRHRHLLLLPAEPLSTSVGSLINSQLPCAILAGYEMDDTDLRIVSVGYVEDFNRSEPWSWTSNAPVPILQDPQRLCGLGQMRLCDGSVRYFAEIRAIDAVHSAEIQLLPFLSHYWHCPVRSARWQFPDDDWCTMVNLILEIKDPWELQLAWMWRKYVLIMPNWWHWQKPDGAGTSQPLIAIAGGLLCWLALVIVRQTATPAGHRCSSLLGMWARMLAVTAEPDVGAPSGPIQGVLLLTSVLGMWNSMVLCGALFELQLGGPEWQPVYRQVADLWAHDNSLRVRDEDLRVVPHIVDVRFRKDGTNYVKRVDYRDDAILQRGEACMVEDGTEVDLIGWWKAYESNGTGMYRKVHDNRLVIPLTIHISPAYLADELHEAEQWFREIGIQQRLFDRQEEWKRWSLDAPIRNGSVVYAEAVPEVDGVDEEFLFVVQFFGGLLAVTVIIWIGELLVAKW